MTIAYPDDASIAALAAGLLDCSLPKPRWTHAAHFAATLWLLRHQPGFDGKQQLPGIIRRYNEASGGENTDSAGYHHTITMASLAAATAALRASPQQPLHLILDHLLAGPQGRSDWLLSHWSHALLFGVPARRAWQPPDLAPLPFPL